MAAPATPASRNGCEKIVGWAKYSRPTSESKAVSLELVDREYLAHRPNGSAGTGPETASWRFVNAKPYNPMLDTDNPENYLVLVEPTERSTTPLMAVASKRHALEHLLQQRVLVLDGAMGTMVQSLGLTESDVRGERFVQHPKSLRNFIDLLCLTRPAAIIEIHRQYLEAGADLVETNTFGSNPIAMRDFELESLAQEINVAAARCARQAVDEFNQRTPDQPRFVAGSIGPTSKTASISPRVDDPGYRAVTFDQLVESYYLQVDALIAGGVDLLFPETTFDTLNLKACLFAIDKFFIEHNVRVPVMASVTITDASGRTLSGQTIEAFWNSISHFDLLSVGINCALGPERMRPYVEELSRLTPVYTSCHPNAGLPNEFGGYDESPAQMCAVLREFVANGWLNIVLLDPESHITYEGLCVCLHRKVGPIK